MHVLRGMIRRRSALEDGIESSLDLNSFPAGDDTGVYQRLAIREAGCDVCLEESAIEAVGIVELGEAGIGLSLKSPAPKFSRLRHEFLPEEV
jgi:hypothetical protein